MRSMLRRGLAGMLGLMAGCLQPMAAPVSTFSLLEEMTDLAGLALYPDPAYTCRQYSSYDRKSRAPGVDWFANEDRGHFLRVETRDGRREHVLMDVAGPGAVVRIWSANPAGTLRVYIDGAEAPALSGLMADVLGGKHPGLPRPLAGEYSKGWNLYFPIPYARHCKITSDEGDFYYHVNYRSYAPGTPVESFGVETVSRCSEAIAAVVRRLEHSETPEGSGGEAFEERVEPGAGLRQELAGPGAIVGAVVRLEAKDREAALRSVLLRIRFDGEAAVEAPLGDFFGTAPGVNVYAGLPLGVTSRGEMYSRWFMPFQRRADIELVNHGREAVLLSGRIATGAAEWTPRSMHFHAGWRAQFDVPTRPMIDWNYLTAVGQGVFAGVAFAIDNPVKEWWGEGDEKIYVDGEGFPSHFGTGTEDYYGYAWCWPEVFSHAYHAQPRCDGPGNYGRTSVNRFHILDRIPFRKEFRFDMELWHWNATARVNLAVTAYWYARPGGGHGFAAIRPENLVLREMPPYAVPRVPGAQEGEALRVIRVQGKVGPQAWDGLSGGAHLWWQEGMRPGDRLALAFRSPQAGRQRIIARFLQARDYGIHRIYINGKAAGEPIDFYQAEVRPTPEVDLGVFRLREGENQLEVEVVGANPRAVPSRMFGLDYLLLRPVD